MARDFSTWMRRVDAVIESVTGFTSSDLPDACYYDMFDDGLSPSRAAHTVLSEEGYF